MQTGIIGLPQVGKTTLFKILTRAHLDEKAARAAPLFETGDLRYA
jgi:ribosome-binding ATPase YchF (GTP1/OBG family)